MHLEQTVEAPIPARVAADTVDVLGTAGHVSTPSLGLAAKRAVDVAVSATLLLVLSPVLLLVALVVRLESPGPAFFCCRRVGAGCREFDMLKFRKMVDGAAGPPLRACDDDRYTRLGRALAASRLDELPQLWNVLRGDMSLVGPRPEDPSFVSRRPADFEKVLRVRPGITGLSQLAFAKEDEILDATDRMGDYVRRVLPLKLAIDTLYAERRSLRMDLNVLLWTTLLVFLHCDLAINRSTGSLNVRRRPAERASLTAADAGGTMTSLPTSARTSLDAPSPTAGHKGKPRFSRARDLRHVQVVILAGGRGTRLAPYTSILPKPLMPVGDRCILETVIEQLAGHGVRRVNLCVGYLSHLIRAVFDNRPIKRVEIGYVQEPDALGTAAPLRLVSGLDDTFIVMNGDVLTTLDYQDLMRHHRESGNLVTIATHDRKIKIDYGVLHLDGDGAVREYEEKPEIVSPVSMGIYVLEPAALAHIPAEGYFDFPSLIEVLLAAGEPVGAYRYDGMWFDIGRRSDYESAVAAWTSEVAEAA